MEEVKTIKRSKRLRGFKETKINNFLKKYGIVIPTQIDKSEKIKLCSSDDFSSVASAFIDKYSDNKAPTMIGHVGGFYVSASLAGMAANICKNNSKPYVLFFDKKIGNVQNSLFNTLLMQACESKEKYITTLFGLTDVDIIKALNPSLYVSYIEEVLSKDESFNELNKKRKKKVLKVLYEKDKDEIDRKIKESFIAESIVNDVLKNNFNLEKIVKFASFKPYDGINHYDILVQLAEKGLDNDTFNLFKKLASNITEYLSIKERYQELLKYLPADIKLNHTNHILANDSIYNGYRSLIDKSGKGYIKFVSGIDISKEQGVKDLECILKNENIISDNIDENSFPIDIAFIPHINSLKDSYPLFKKNVQDYIMLYKDSSKKKNYFVMNSTAALDIRTLESIGAKDIKEERENRQSLTHLEKIDAQKGYPLLMFMAGANFGNIYHSEVDTMNMIDMAIANKVDTVYIQGLIYSTYYHNQTSRRMLSDPTYETLSSRLKAAHKIIERLNNAGIKVVYQMGDEEYHLYEDLFKIYVREQGVIGNNFLEREDLRSRFDWVRPIIIQQLIPYLIRSGEDVVNFYTDEANKTNVSEVCHALKKALEGFPLGNLAKYINPKYLKDSDMFKIVYSTIDKFDKDDPAISVDLISNPNFSTITQYGKPNSGAIKNLRYYQSGAVSRDGNSPIPQLKVDSRQGFMSIAYQGDQLAMNVPQMINDGYYIENHELLSGIKEHVLEDPTHKRITQGHTRPNYPGGWIVTGDIREKMTIIPYYRRPREVMEHVQRTGVGLPLKTQGLINDWQIGSPTERPYYDVKFLDYLFYECNPTGLTFNGDLQQGHNYGKFPNESRHLGSMSVTQQMVSNTKLVRPYMREGVGVIKKGFKKEGDNYKIDENISNDIINHLSSVGLIDHNVGTFESTDRIKRDIDYKTVDLKLPYKLKPFEKDIREKLSNIINLENVDIDEGNHELNTDWNYKGFNETEILRQEFNNLKEFSGSDVDITLTEFMVNSRGDIVNAPYTFRSINGYNVINGHYFKPGGKGGGSSPTVGISKWLEQMAGNTSRIDIVNAAHYHIFESSVIDNTVINITGGGAGQSGYEQNLGYSSSPLYVIQWFMKDGNLCIETVGTKFLDEYKIQNPYVKEKGIDKFIQECMTEEATIFDRDKPKQMQKVYQRKLVPREPNKIIGPKID